MCSRTILPIHLLSKTGTWHPTKHPSVLACIAQFCFPLCFRKLNEKLLWTLRHKSAIELYWKSNKICILLFLSFMYFFSNFFNRSFSMIKRMLSKWRWFLCKFTNLKSVGSCFWCGSYISSQWILLSSRTYVSPIFKV